MSLDPHARTMPAGAGWISLGMRAPAVAGSILFVLLAAACSRPLPAPLEQAPRSTAVTTAGPNQSMIHLARVRGGVIVVDLGWWGAEDALDDGLEDLGATRKDVIAVFLTHAHRDHIGAWRAVAHAPFHMAEDEVEFFFGKEEPGGWIPRLADWIVSRDVPAPDEVEVRSFASDTHFTFGADTLYAFEVPGHTPGSAAYLFRGTLFAGDAIARTPLLGFQPARRGYSDDVDEARRSLEDLRERLSDHEVRYVCSGHAECTEVTAEFWTEVLNGPF